MRKLRRIRLGALLEVVAAKYDAIVQEIAENIEEESGIDRARVVHADLSKTFEEQPGPGRPRLSDLYYAQVAAKYVARLPSRTARAELAAQLNLSSSHVGALLLEARKRELLTRPPTRRTGGELTAKARKLLAKTEGT